MMTYHARKLAVALSVWGLFATASAQVSSSPDEPVVESSDSVSLDVGQSTVVRASWPAKRISIADPKIADIEVLSPERVLVSAKSIGSTDLVMWSQDEEVHQTTISVDVDLNQLNADLVRLFPTGVLSVSRSKNVVVLTGSLSRVEHAEQLRRFLEATGITYVDLTSVAGVQQVELEVRVAEASRNALREMGINTTVRGTTEHGGGEFFRRFGNDFGQATVGPTTGLIDVLAGFPHADLEILLEAMAENQYLQILAKPNLTALSGEEASFLAGGEFPIPVVQGGFGGNAASISIEYKEFGIHLAFRPVVLGDGKIRLEVSTEVSDITDVGSVEIQGFRVPAIITRRADTTLQLGSGQTFGMAGLIQQTTEGSNARLPWLGDLPVLGPFFSSKRYERGETELVVLVRATLVEPLSLASDVPVPGDMHVPPTDYELYGEGRLEHKPSYEVDPPDAAWRQALGIEDLKSPGVWARYGSARISSRSTVKARTIEKKKTQEAEDEKKKKTSIASIK